MTNIETLLATKLHEKLKSQVRGKITVKVIPNNRLFVYIQPDSADEAFKMYIDNFSDRVLNGWSTDYAAYEVKQAYRKFIISGINKKYFY